MRLFILGHERGKQGATCPRFIAKYGPVSEFVFGRQLALCCASATLGCRLLLPLCLFSVFTCGGCRFDPGLCIGGPGFL